MLSALEARQRTLRRITDLGFPEPPKHLPVLADDELHFVLRTTDEVIERALVLNVRINLAFGMPTASARDWLSANSLLDCLSTRETDLVSGTAQSSEQEKLQIEGLWALAWSLGLTPRLDHGAYCGDELAALLPDLRAQESSRTWRSRTEPSLRAGDELLAELDLLYVMTWGIANANLTGASMPGAVDQYVFWERRRALEFLQVGSSQGHAGWDEIDLST